MVYLPVCITSALPSFFMFLWWFFDFFFDFRFSIFLSVLGFVSWWRSSVAKVASQFLLMIWNTTTSTNLCQIGFYKQKLWFCLGWCACMEWWDCVECVCVWVEQEMRGGVRGMDWCEWNGLVCMCMCMCMYVCRCMCVHVCVHQSQHPSLQGLLVAHHLNHPLVCVCVCVCVLIT